MATIPDPASDAGEATVIRTATPADAVAIVALVRALAAHVGDPAAVAASPEDMAAAGSGAHPLWRGVVAELGGELVAVCLYSLQYSTWIGAAGLYVIDLYVSPSYRRDQLGRRLLAAAAREARTLGCRFIRLEVDHRNLAVAPFYERLGFQKRAGDTIFLLKPDGFAALADS